MKKIPQSGLLWLPIILFLACAETEELDKRSLIIVNATAGVEPADGSSYAPYKSLTEAISQADDGAEILVLPGRYEATPQPYQETLCGNCEVHATPVQATVGFHIKDKALTIRGWNVDSVVLITAAGYGLFFESSWGSVLTDLTITGGVRDPDGNATDAAVVAKSSRLTVEKCKIIDNTNRLDSVVVGIGGVFGREGCELIIRDNLIQNNGWDGIALYRGAHAFICNNVIDKGRGAGIGITWDASAIVIGNRVSNYWKGIGTFGNSSATVTNNLIFDNLGWGVIATGLSIMEVRNNVIARNGNCGFAVWSEDARGYLRNNIIVNNGWKEEWVCPCVGVWMNGKLPNFPVSYNDVWNNAAGNYLNMPEWTGRYGNLSVDPEFMDSLDFRLKPSSPLWGRGDPYYTNPDGNHSDMGAYGGQGARFGQSR